MSGKSNFMKSIGLKKSKAPRALEEIKKEYGEASSKAANAQYMVFVYGKELETINKRMLELNQEADARNKLSAEEAKRQDAAKQGEGSNAKS